MAQRKCEQPCCTPECTTTAALRSGAHENKAEITSVQSGMFVNASFEKEKKKKMIEVVVVVVVIMTVAS